VTATPDPSGQPAATTRRNDSDDAEDKNNNADELAHARIAAAPNTARSTAGCRNGKNGARRHGGNKITPPALAGGDCLVGGTPELADTSESPRSAVSDADKVVYTLPK
jgi:hypothetical protein